ncbi:hypothetical protein H5410_064458 [Solanum commersonii]|uniref:Uncharacterized protein n=1 Tax=Solanum commersonii TaxID=4109 RepID=A0A9J5VZF6_SOLCO|nr:hypothetical protein H5410_064458 [Solanum commersonii]
MSSTLKARLSAEWASCPIHSNAAWVSGGWGAAVIADLGGIGVVEGLGVIEGTTLDIPKGPEAGVGNTASTGNVSVSITGLVSTGASLLLSASSRVYSASMRQMSMKDVGITSTSFFTSKGTRIHLHSSMINTRKGRDVWRYLALMANSWPTIIPKLRSHPSITQPRQASFLWRRIDSFWDGMIVLLIKPN